ncbi:tetratricopeptide repeat protein [Undibacterium fentianense]|uniref:Tetratricopeptide repeat protein n=1 Tax=Undibacterium fentianense TaxID=2828728 RepID=A0A941E2G4_9BURK|nr:tetratricopeptide repeat protein [Undibacterium fentianense]MBR7801125.1 tetratricopeptide repeat protein [Undibacterium fentianense]
MTTPFTLKTSILFLTICATQLVQAHEYDALIKAKKYADVEKAVSTKLATEPNNPDALVARTELILIEGKESRLDEAVKIAEQCIAHNPKHSECHESLGNVLGTKAMRGGVMSAISYVGKIRDSFKKAIELDAFNFDARSSLMQFYLQAPSFVGGGTGKAKDLIVETIKVSPAAGALLQASLDLHEENMERAISGALAVNTSNSESLAKHQRNTLSNIGHSLVNEKKMTEAERIFRELCQRFPDSSLGFYGMGKTLQEQGKMKDAVPHFEKSIAIDANANAYYRLAKAWQQLGEKVKAIATFEKALNFKPELAKKSKSDAEEQLRLLKASI